MNTHNLKLEIYHKEFIQLCISYNNNYNTDYIFHHILLKNKGF
jgi:hypothetical protein